MVNGSTKKQNKEADTMMTSVMSLHNIDVSEFLSVLDTCEGNV